MFQIIIEKDIRAELTESLLDKNLMVTIKKGSQEIIKDYAMLDSEDTGEVFKDFNNNVVGFLNDYLDADQQTETLTVEVYRNNESVYSFEITLRALKKHVRSVYKIEANKIIREQGVVQTKELRDNVINQMQDQTTTQVLLAMFGLIALRYGGTNIGVLEWKEQQQITE